MPRNSRLCSPVPGSFLRWSCSCCWWAVSGATFLSVCWQQLTAPSVPFVSHKGIPAGITVGKAALYQAAMVALLGRWGNWGRVQRGALLGAEPPVKEEHLELPPAGTSPVGLMGKLGGNLHLPVKKVSSLMGCADWLGRWVHREELPWG